MCQIFGVKNSQSNETKANSMGGPNGFLGGNTQNAKIMPYGWQNFNRCVKLSRWKRNCFVVTFYEDPIKDNDSYTSF